MAHNPISYRGMWLLGAISIAVMIALYSAVSLYQHSVNATDTTIPTGWQIWQGIYDAFKRHEPPAAKNSGVSPGPARKVEQTSPKTDDANKDSAKKAVTLPPTAGEDDKAFTDFETDDDITVKEQKDAAEQEAAPKEPVRLTFWQSIGHGISACFSWIFACFRSFFNWISACWDAVWNWITACWNPIWSPFARWIGLVPPHERWIVMDTYATGFRLLFGLIIGLAISIALGVLMGCSFYVEALLVPPLSFFAKVPPTGVFAVFFVLLNTGEPLYLAIIAFGIVPSLAQVVYLAVREVPDELVFKAKTLGASRYEIIWDVIIPHAFPKILDAIRLQIGPAVVYLIGAEMIIGEVGFGYRIRQQYKLLNMSVVYPYLALLAGFGFLGDYSLQWLRKKLCPWYNAE